MLQTVTLLAGISALVLCVPPLFITEEYVQKFQEGIEALKKQAEGYERKEYDFKPEAYDEAAAIANAEEYDFIVVGAGASGSAVASRLSEVPEWKVLLLEAGEAETPVTKIPAYHGLLYRSPYNWDFHTTPQKTWCLGMKDHVCPIESGKALGGSTAINAMLYTRGNNYDYDAWSDLDNKGWCYDDILPYFKKIEDAHIEHFDHKYHNRGGPLHIEHSPYSPHLAHDFIAAANEVGIETRDYNGKEQLGVSKPQVTSKNGKRHSAADAYLEHAYPRKNLVVKPLSIATQVIISPHTKTATGVKYLHDGKIYVAKASKEVILSAGAINTPKLLMLSGIGPKEDLEHLGIECVKDLAVGRHLKDHLGFMGLNFIYNETKHEEEHDCKKELTEYLKEGEGPLTSTGIHVLGYIKTKKAKSHDKKPDVEFFVHDNIYNKGLNNLKSTRISEETYDSLWKPLEGQKGFSIGLFATHPKSTGVVKLKDKDPLHYPLVDPNQLSDPDDYDIETMVAGIHKVLDIVHAEPLQKLGIHMNKHPVHGCEEHEFGTDDYWKCAIRHVSCSLRHLSGTARMGPEHDKYAVVDNTTMVYGVHNLRVADTSIIPVSITGHYMAAAYLIGEKVADLIKTEWTS